LEEKKEGALKTGQGTNIGVPFFCWEDAAGPSEVTLWKEVFGCQEEKGQEGKDLN